MQMSYEKSKNNLIKRRAVRVLFENVPIYCGSSIISEQPPF